MRQGSTEESSVVMVAPTETLQEPAVCTEEEKTDHLVPFPAHRWNTSQPGWKETIIQKFYWKKERNGEQVPPLQPHPDLVWTVLKSIFFLLTLGRILPLWKQKKKIMDEF